MQDKQETKQRDQDEIDAEMSSSDREFEIELGDWLHAHMRPA